MKKTALIASLFAVVSFCIFSYLKLDIAVAAYFYEARPLNGFFEIVTRFGESKWYLLGFGALFLIFRYFFRLKSTANRFLYLFLAIAGSGLISDVLKFIFGRARPKLYFEKSVYGINFFGLDHLYTSFPSGHSTTAFSLAVGAYAFLPRFGPLLILLAFLIAFSRVAITAHYLGDVVAGVYIGTVFTLWLKTKMIDKGIKF